MTGQQSCQGGLEFSLEEKRNKEVWAWRETLNRNQDGRNEAWDYVIYKDGQAGLDSASPTQNAWI